MAGDYRAGLSAELDSLDAEATRSSTVARRAGSVWRGIRLSLGLMSAIAAALAAATGLASTAGRVPAAILALVAAGLSAASTFIRSEDRESSNRQAVSAWSTLARDARLVRIFEGSKAPSVIIRDQVSLLLERRQAILAGEFEDDRKLRAKGAGRQIWIEELTKGTKSGDGDSQEPSTEKAPHQRKERGPSGHVRMKPPRPLAGASEWAKSPAYSSREWAMSPGPAPPSPEDIEERRREEENLRREQEALEAHRRAETEKRLAQQREALAARRDRRAEEEAQLDQVRAHYEQVRIEADASQDHLEKGSAREIEIRRSSLEGLGALTDYSNQDSVDIRIGDIVELGSSRYLVCRDPKSGAALYGIKKSGKGPRLTTRIASALVVRESIIRFEKD